MEVHDFRIERRNPQMEEKIKVTAKFTPKFKPAREFKEAVKYSGLRKNKY